MGCSCLAMNTSNAAAVFTNAVETINRGHDGNYHQADRWLQEFKYDPNAWGTLVDLISQSSNSDVLFHAATMANSKALNEWSDLSDDIRRSLVQVVRYMLRTAHIIVAVRCCISHTQQHGLLQCGTNHAQSIVLSTRFLWRCCFILHCGWQGT